MADIDQMNSAPDHAAIDPQASLPVTFTHHGKSYTFDFLHSSTVNDLATRIETDLQIPIANQKFMLKPKLEILKPSTDSSNATPLSKIASRSVTLLAPTAADLSSISRPAPRPTSTVPAARPSRYRDWQKTQDEATYTFHTIVPLPYLPKPERSTAFLSRLRDDPGIKAAMRKHKFSVGVLTEMNPADHTTHESKTLGLNRNKGEVIELRLRTDAYDGYRDYKVIRDTLCHELAHNVWGEHDRNFWDLCHLIEKEVRANDWKSGGRAVSNEVFYDPADPENRHSGAGGHVDGGGWEGGQYVLGRDGGRIAEAETQGLERRELMARAAEARTKKQSEVEKGKQQD